MGKGGGPIWPVLKRWGGDGVQKREEGVWFIYNVQTIMQLKYEFVYVLTNMLPGICFILFTLVCP